MWHLKIIEQLYYKQISNKVLYMSKFDATANSTVFYFNYKKYFTPASSHPNQTQVLFKQTRTVLSFRTHPASCPCVDQQEKYVTNVIVVRGLVPIKNNRPKNKHTSFEQPQISSISQGFILYCI